MRVAVVNVGTDGFRSPAMNGGRSAVLTSLLAQASAAGCDLLLLPGGFLTVVGEAAVATALAPLQPVLATHGVSVIAGIDAVPDRGGRLMIPTGSVAAGTLPMFGVVWTPSGFSGPWRQRSIVAADDGRVPDGLAQQVRSVMVADEQVGILICGEIFNATIRDAYRAAGIRIVVVSGHTGFGWRPFQGLEPLTERPGGIPEVLACAHVSNATGCQYRYSMGAVAGDYREDLWVDGPPWASAAVFDL
jgi:hypothetical protein